MKTWDQYKEHVKRIDSTAKKDMEDIESISTIVSAMIKQRNLLGISQRELATLCDMPQSSIARIESMQITPKLDTLLKIMRPLGLGLTVTPIK